MPQYTAGRRALLSAGLALFAMTAAGCGLLAVTYITSAQFEGWRRPAAAAALALAAVAAAVMLIDCFDLWFRGRRFTGFSVRMIRAAVLVIALAGFILSFAARVPGVMIVAMPAYFIYLAVALRSRPTRGAVSLGRTGQSGVAPNRGPGGGAKSSAAAHSRQRRGGRKRR